jgi:predicted Zn-dependent protease
LRERTTNDELATWFGLATALVAQRDFPAADRALAQVRQRLPQGHAMVERLAAEARLRAGDPAGALALAEAGAARFPGARGLVRLQAEALLASGQAVRAERLLQEQLATLRSDPVLWRLLAQAHHAAGHAALAHVATAEEYALGGNWRAAVEQLRLSRRAGPPLDFYTGSLVDARLKEFEQEFQREQADRVRSR